MVAILERLAKEGKSFPDASYNPVVNIKFLSGTERSKSSPNNIAIYFTGKDNKFRYYVHIDEDGKLVPFQQKLPVSDDDWQNHLKFTNYYHTPDASCLISSEGSPHTFSGGDREFDCVAASPKSSGAVSEPKLRKHGLSGPNVASATNVQAVSKEQQDGSTCENGPTLQTTVTDDTCSNEDKLTGASNGSSAASTVET